MDAVYPFPPAEALKIRGVVLIVHGLAEHGGRYTTFAEALAKAGFVVYAPDLPGHGKSEPVFDFFHLREFLKKQGDKIKKDHPDLPFFLFGHSLGALLVLDFIAHRGEGIRGAILSGMVEVKPYLAWMGYFVALGEAWLRGSKRESLFTHRLLFLRYSRAISPRRTAFDWLSRDEEEVKRYISDPTCGKALPTGFYVGLFSFLKGFKTKRLVKATPKDLPLHFIGGTEDPVGGKTRALKKILREYEKAGFSRITVKLYPACRHELLHEINREKVIHDLVVWLENLAS